MISKRALVLGGAALAALAACIPAANVEHVASGASAPAFSVADATGATRTLAEFSGPERDPRMDQQWVPVRAQAL